MNILFKNIRLISPEQDIDSHVNLHIVDGIIKNCSSNHVNITNNMQVIEASNLVAAPGFVDIHVHFREPGAEYKEDMKSGAAAAANAGFTEVVCMPNTSPAIDNVLAIEYLKNKAKNLPVNIHVAAAITKNRAGNELAPMLELAEAGAICFTDDGSCVASAEVMKRAFDFAATKDLLIAQHCEEHSITENFTMNESEVSYKLGLKGYPTVAEEIIIDRDIKLSEYAGNRRYHIQHISTRKAVELVRQAKNNGLRISAEATPHHIWFTDCKIENYDTNYKMNPPLRKQDDINAVIDGIKDGTIDCIASDHAPHSYHDCDVEFEKAPNGIIGLETQLGAILTKLYHNNHISLKHVVNIMAINMRKILQLEGVIIKNEQMANLTVFAPNEEWIVDKNKFLSKSRNTPFHDMKFVGKPKYIVNNLQLVESNL